MPPPVVPQLGLRGIRPASGLIPGEDYGLPEVMGRRIKIVDAAALTPRSEAAKWFKSRLGQLDYEQMLLKAARDDLAKGIMTGALSKAANTARLKSANNASEGHRMVRRAVDKILSGTSLTPAEGRGALTVAPEGDLSALMLTRGPASTGRPESAFLDYLGATSHAKRGEATKLFDVVTGPTEAVLPESVKDLWLTPLDSDYYAKSYSGAEYVPWMDLVSDANLYPMFRDLGELHNARSLGAVRIPLHRRNGGLIKGGLSALAAAMSDDAEAGWPSSIVQTAKGRLRLQHYDPDDLKAAVRAGSAPAIHGPDIGEGMRLAKMAARNAGRTYIPGNNLLMAIDDATGRPVGAMRFVDTGGHVEIEELGSLHDKAGIGSALVKHLRAQRPVRTGLTAASDVWPFYERLGFQKGESVPWSDSISRMTTE